MDAAVPCMPNPTAMPRRAASSAPRWCLTPHRLCSTMTRALLLEEMPMSLQPVQARCTVEDYLALERASEERHAYLDGQVYAMAGESPEHGTICTNMTMLIAAQLRGTPCQAWAKDTKVHSG